MRRLKPRGRLPTGPRLEPGQRIRVHFSIHNREDLYLGQPRRVNPRHGAIFGRTGAPCRYSSTLRSRFVWQRFEERSKCPRNRRANSSAKRPRNGAATRRFSFRNERERFHSATLSRSHAPENYETSGELWVNDSEAQIFVGVVSRLR